MQKFETRQEISSLSDTCKKLCFPAPVIKKTIDSTSTYLRVLAADGAAHGTVVIAERQSAGRGRTGKSFLSPEGGLYMSVLVKRDLSPDILEIITPTAAVVTAMAVKEVFDVDVSVKWVNDLFSDGKKVCGILTEVVRAPSDAQVCYVILGIGVNVFEPSAGFGELSSIAASLLSQNTDSGQIFKLASAIVEKLFTLLKVCNREYIYSEYRKRLFILGRNILVLRGENTVAAKVIDLERDFSLTVSYEDGKQEKLTSGEISIIPM